MTLYVTRSYYIAPESIPVSIVPTFYGRARYPLLELLELNFTRFGSTVAFCADRTTSYHIIYHTLIRFQPLVRYVQGITHHPMPLLYVSPVEKAPEDSPCWRLMLLRGAIFIKTYGTHKNLYVSMFSRTIFGPIYYGPP